MPISDFPQHELDKMTAQQLADLALAADVERRRLERLGDYCAAATWDRESARLADISRRVA